MSVRGYIQTLLNALPVGTRQPVQQAFDALYSETSGVTARTYGSASAAPVITVDARGRVTAASETDFPASATAIPPVARVSAGSLVPIATGSTTRIAFDTQEFVSVIGLHSTTTNPTRITLASSGVWVLTASVAWSIGSTVGMRMLRLLLNGTVLAASRINAARTADVTEQSVTAIYRASSTGAFVEAEVWQNSGSTASLAVTDLRPSLAAAMLR